MDDTCGVRWLCISYTAGGTLRTTMELFAAVPNVFICDVIHHIVNGFVPLIERAVNGSFGSSIYQDFLRFRG